MLSITRLCIISTYVEMVGCMLSWLWLYSGSGALRLDTAGVNGQGHLCLCGVSLRVCVQPCLWPSPKSRHRSYSAAGEVSSLRFLTNYTLHLWRKSSELLAASVFLVRWGGKLFREWKKHSWKQTVLYSTVSLQKRFFIILWKPFMMYRSRQRSEQSSVLLDVAVKTWLRHQLNFSLWCVTFFCLLCDYDFLFRVIFIQVLTPSNGQQLGVACI